MKIEALGDERREQFIEYCRKHRKGIDDSFLYDEDLRNFTADEQNPTCILTGSRGEIRAAASLILDDYHRRGRKGRFRIFHSEDEDTASYRMLLKAVLPYSRQLDRLFLFVPVENGKLAETFTQLGFTLERYTFFLLREEQETAELSLPANYSIRPFRPGIDESAWCEVRNTAFRDLRGNETPVTPEMVKKLTTDSSYLEGGLMLLLLDEKPVGIVRGASDEYEGNPAMNIGPLAVLPEYQGKGLGRNLLRAALQFAREKGYGKTVLCVNAENERAKSLYTQEGFREVEAVGCYVYDLNEKVLKENTL